MTSKTSDIGKADFMKIIQLSSKRKINKKINNKQTNNPRMGEWEALFRVTKMLSKMSN